MTIETFFLEQSQTVFSMAVAGYLLIRTTAELKKNTEILKVISAQLTAHLK